jgi:putative endonuclease
MKFAVYILYSRKDKKLYVGQTVNLEKRLVLHFSGRVKSTKSRLPLELIKSEEYDTRAEAMKREKYLKSLFGAKEKEKILKEFLSNGSSINKF